MVCAASRAVCLHVALAEPYRDGRVWRWCVFGQPDTARAVDGHWKDRLAGFGYFKLGCVKCVVNDLAISVDALQGGPSAAMLPEGQGDGDPLKSGRGVAVTLPEFNF